VRNSLVFCCLLLFLVNARAQNDSTLLLAPERLTERDIRPRDLSQRKSVAQSATRTLEAIEDLPFTTVVFTAEDILRNGFVTLTDVLKAAPGIRVSQPGNAVEGETFMLRGLSGNQHVKVLINDVPIKPSIALGMPIGAQLPIRQAERIEILYGPAAAIYGDETCAGVVNIILKESERPVYTQADLAFGRFGYNSLDLMFGGKIGKDRKIFRFSLYGSSTVRESTDIFYDQSIYNVNQYLPFGLDSSLYRDLRNYRSAAPGTGDNFPRTAPLSHESRMFGINLTWRGYHFTYHRMLRADHTALGINPLAIGYANPSNRLAERIETFSVGFQRTRARRTTFTNISFQRYEVDNNSTTTYVFDRLSAVNYLARGGPALSDSARQTLLREIYNWYASEERFATAKGIDLRIESRMSIPLSKRLQLDLGAQANTGAGAPLSTYYSVPVEVFVLGNDILPTIFEQPISVVHDYFGLNVLGFSQLAWRGKKLHIIGGGSASLRVGESAGFVVAPRLGALYHLDSVWTIRANVATGLRQSSLYGNINSYTIVPESGFSLSAGARESLGEQTYATEAAVRYTKSGRSLEGIFFWQDAYRLFRPGYLVEEPGIVRTLSYGYKNAPGLALSMWGIQAVYRTGWKSTDLKVNGDKTTVLSNRTEFFVQYTRGKEWFGYDLPATDEVRNQPKWHTQFRYYFKAGKKFELVFASNRQTSSLSKSLIFKDLYQLPERPRLATFRTWDAMSRLYLSNHFLVYFQMLNIFNKRYAGIDATGTPDDILYNPQQGRQWRVGVNYNMN
jgi:outer membrane receptor protein involved in Fe transport